MARTIKISRRNALTASLLTGYMSVLQVDLHLSATNTVGRRVPTVLSSVGSIAFFASLSRRKGSVVSNQAWIYVYLVCTTFSLMLVEMIELFTNLHSSIDDFQSNYDFPSWLCYAIVFLAAMVLLGVPPLMLLFKSNAPRAACALVIWSFNALDGAVFESNTVVDACYKTQQMLYENVLYGFLFLASVHVRVPDWLPW
tara:strand:+ start:6557 stop:7150 length:594 start_codon:yes stop_codon:yes gene_type:complete